MNKKNAKAVPEPAEAKETEAPAAMSAAERLGRALLESFGGVEGMSEDELVDAILGEWKPGGRREDAADRRAAERRAAEKIAAKTPEEGAFDPFEGTKRRPVPIRAGSAEATPVDYSDMTPKQFSELKKLLKKAAMDGKRIKI